MAQEKSKKGGEGRMMNGRVAVRQSTLDRIRDLANGMRITQDEAINMALDRFIPQDEDAYQFGKRLLEEQRKGERQDD